MEEWDVRCRFGLFGNPERIVLTKMLFLDKLLPSTDYECAKEV